MPTVLITFLWDKIPSFVRWTLAGIILVMWIPEYIKSIAKDFVHTEAKASMVDYKVETDKRLLVLETKVIATREDTHFIKYYMLNKRAPRNPPPEDLQK